MQLEADLLIELKHESALFNEAYCVFKISLDLRAYEVAKRRLCVFWRLIVEFRLAKIVFGG